MALSVIEKPEIKVADEVFIATALLHRENPGRADFTIREIVQRVLAENLYGELRPGISVHVSMHCVANKAPNPGRYQMLYATGLRTRRLLRATDDVHPLRTGKIWPVPDDVPPRYRELIDWAKEQYGESAAKSRRWLGSVLDLSGAGADHWSKQDPDEYVRELRESWV
jgi:hypothetical protein